MTSVISPWFFYWISVLDTLGFCLAIMATIGLIVGLGIMGMAAMDPYEFGDKDTAKKAYKKGKLSFILSIIVFILTIFIPTQDVCLQMLIAHNVTYERIETAGQTVEEICADIIDLSTKYEKSVSE